MGAEVGAFALEELIASFGAEAAIGGETIAAGAAVGEGVAAGGLIDAATGAEALDAGATLAAGETGSTAAGTLSTGLAAPASGLGDWLGSLKGPVAGQIAASAVGALLGGTAGAGATPLRPRTPAVETPPASQATMSPTYQSIGSTLATRYAAQAANDSVSVDRKTLNLGKNGRNTLLTGGGGGNTLAGE